MNLKTAEEILAPYVESVLRHTKVVDKDNALIAMEKYKGQFDYNIMDGRKIELEDLKKHYDFVCNEYIKLFCEKQKIDFDGWISDEIGGIAAFISEYYFSMSDIVFDLHTNQPVNLILDWQSDGVDAHFENPELSTINYMSYTMGLRYEDIKQKPNEQVK